jgi:TatD DNase family protein
VEFVDSHCHIDGERFDEDRDAVILRAAEAGVVAMLVVGTGDPRSGGFEGAVALAEGHPGMYAAVGVHPHDASLYDAAAEATICSLANASPKVVAWGEIGLDYYYDHSPRDVQRDVFTRQLRKAREMALPVIIHSRDADDDTVEILQRECSYDGFKGVMHCFGGTPRMVSELLPLGFLFSFSGNVTFKKAEGIRESAKVVPLDRLMIETDAPFLAPEPFRGKRNEPAYVVETARFLASLHGVDVAEIARRTTANFYSFVGIAKTAEV